jgi:hypothetical protein
VRVELVHGRYLLCGGLISEEQVKPGQTWAAADGSDRTVKVDFTQGDWVGYSWQEGSQSKHHQKLIFAFQCRYCLVLETPEIPKELL